MQKRKPTITIDRLKEVLDYDPDTGIFTWRKRPKYDGGVKVGRRAGAVNSYGYICFMVDRRTYLAHRLAWLYTHGELPSTEIDHINGDRSDNRISNLRLASRSQNIANCKRFSGKEIPKGVNRQGGGYVARITKHGKTRYLGTFQTPDEAAAAYEAAARAMFGEFARVA